MAKPFTGNPNITEEFVGRWAQGLIRAAKLLRAQDASLSERNSIRLAADVVRDVLGADFINISTLNRAVKVAYPDPLEVV